jgi:hypothetical protein
VTLAAHGMRRLDGTVRMTRWPRLRRVFAFPVRCTLLAGERGGTSPRDLSDMTEELLAIEGERCLVVDADGPRVRDADGGRSLVEDAMNHRARVVVVPVERLDPAFFELRSGIAGEVVQKVLNYGLKFAVIGDISAHVAASDALRDFVIESDRGHSIFFAPDLQALAERLTALRAG